MNNDYENVILGYGEISIGSIPIGMTRENGQFTVERTYHQIKRNGSKGIDKGSMILDEERAKLKFSFLELSKENLVKVFPGLIDESGKVSPTFEIKDTDYQDITWLGKTKKGDAIKIELKNAFNQSNIDWTLIEKDEIKQEVEFEATYDGTSKPYSITYGTIGG
ncbi:MAG: hypothetical protein RR738_04850 [Anaerorhabdus sp.]|uniref:hypothetical protein n=1 Tax=Anaerorhabdus sp. TaxID=1872524 RepID=UPI002FC929D0